MNKYLNCGPKSRWNWAQFGWASENDAALRAWGQIANKIHGGRGKQKQRKP